MRVSKSEGEIATGLEKKNIKMTAQQVSMRGDRERERASTTKRERVRERLYTSIHKRTRKPPHLFTQQYVLMVNTNTKYVSANNNVNARNTHNILKQ